MRNAPTGSFYYDTLQESVTGYWKRADRFLQTVNGPCHLVVKNLKNGEISIRFFSVHTRLQPTIPSYGSTEKQDTGTRKFSILFFSVHVLAHVLVPRIGMKVL